MRTTTGQTALNIAVAAVFLVLMRTFVWPTFAPHAPLQTQSTERNELLWLEVGKDLSGKWIARVRFKNGEQTAAQVWISQYAQPGDKRPLESNPIKRIAMPGLNVATIELQRPNVADAVNVAKLSVTMAKADGTVLAQREWPIAIEWPDARAYQYVEELARLGPQQAEAQLKSLLVEPASTPSMLHALGLAKAVLAVDRSNAAASQAMVYIQTHAIWSPRGQERIDSSKTMWQEVNVLQNAAAFAELDQLTANLVATNSRLPNGRSRLLDFYQATDENDKDPSSPTWPRYKDFLKSWLKAQPESSTARIMWMRTLSAHAWAHRGDGYANTVSKEQWVQFHRLIDEAIQYGLACRELCSRDPDWYATMIALLMDHSTDDVRMVPLFVEGRKRFPDYYQIYVAASRKFLPQWGGSYETVERFAQQLITEYPPAKRDEVYATLYTNIASYGSAFGEPPVSQWKADCSRWLRGLEGRAARYPVASNFNLAAYIASQCGNREVTRKYLKKIAGQPHLPEWGADPESASREYARVEAWAR